MRKRGLDVEIPGAYLAYPLRVVLAGAGYQPPASGIPLSFVECVDHCVQQRVDAFQGGGMQPAQLRSRSVRAEQRAQLPERVFERRQQPVLVAQRVARLDLVGVPPQGQGVKEPPDVVKKAA